MIGSEYLVMHEAGYPPVIGDGFCRGEVHDDGLRALCP